MNYYNEIKNKIIANEIYSKVKDYSKERHKDIKLLHTLKLVNCWMKLAVSMEIIF